MITITTSLLIITMCGWVGQVSTTDSAPGERWRETETTPPQKKRGQPCVRLHVKVCLSLPQSSLSDKCMLWRNTHVRMHSSDKPDTLYISTTESSQISFIYTSPKSQSCSLSGLYKLYSERLPQFLEKKKTKKTLTPTYLHVSCENGRASDSVRLVLV